MIGYVRASLFMLALIAGLLFPVGTASADEQAQLVMTRSPKVSGSHRVAHTLTVSKPLFRTTPSRISYRWLRDDQPIAGAWKSTYKLSWRDFGHRVSVRTTAMRSGYATRVIETGAAEVGHRKAWRRTVTYTVQTRGRITAGIENFKTMADQSLNDPRGWRSDGIAFRRVASGGSMTLVLAEAKRVPDFSSACSSSWSCRVGRYVVINQNRWQLASPAWNKAGGSLRDYRHMVVNHESGHWLGWSHRGCSTRGGAAPVMMQQSKGLNGCRFNPWPLTSELNVPRYR